MPRSSFADHVEPALKPFRSRIEAELASQGLPTDRESVIGICTALACLVQGPHGVALASKPAPYATYAGVAEVIRVVEEEFPALVVALRTLVDELAQDPQLQARVQHAINAGILQPCDVRQAVRSGILLVFANRPADQPSSPGGS
jgi:hypothetical protein